MTTNNQIQTLHNLYIELTRLNYPLPVGQYYIWENFIARGHGEAELRIVIRHLNRGIADHERRKSCLRFTYLLGDMDHFGEELAMAQKEFRTKRAYSPGKQQVLKVTARPHEPPTKEAESIAVVLERTKLAAMLREWRTMNSL